MSRLKSELKNKDRQLTVAKISVICITVICFALIFVIYTFPSTLRIFIPPDMRAASQRPWWEVPPATVYAFAYQTFQQLNRWTLDGTNDYEKNITALKPYLTPSCEAFLQKDYEDRQRHSELRDRVRGVYEIPGRGFSDERVIIHNQDSWTVNLDLSVDEYYKDEPVKRVLTRFPISIVRMDVDSQRNPWGLGFNCYSSIPLRLEASETGEKK
ncbi:PFL_4703 family integrating conjugative element protein [Conservatibacter flavescens]|uniref:TIGR03746 family integrating conjugative element protein n=1 Tax=Conservatibacter flavescens TaxID=28161 RepID=A0A2M8S0Y9_9PAST|nr:TIGR03746 family integrating conjugative element protein [Conservatibacter flavescens]PJG84807.1 TIGR03746 family integrating conjugative element protein [Conservatibacter flavescens]